MRHAGDRHIGVADRLDLLHAVLGGQPVEALEEVVQHRHRAERSERTRYRDESDDVGEEHRNFVEAVRDRRLGSRLEPFGDLGGENAVEQRLRLRLRLLGGPEGVVDKDGDDDRDRHHHGDVELQQEARIAAEEPDRKQHPARDMQRDRDRDKKRDQPNPPELEDQEDRGGRRDEVDLNAGLPPHQRDEDEKARHQRKGDEE